MWLPVSKSFQCQELPNDSQAPELWALGQLTAPAASSTNIHPEQTALLPREGIHYIHGTISTDIKNGCLKVYIYTRVETKIEAVELCASHRHALTSTSCFSFSSGRAPCLALPLLIQTAITGEMAHNEDVEILVHIGAPSRACDDARYRALASSYMAFEPVGIREEPEHAVSRLHTGPAAASHAEPRHVSFRQSQEEYAPGEFIPSLNLSWKSAIDNSGSQVNRTRRQEVIYTPTAPQTPGNTVPSQSSVWETPPSVVQDSYPTHLNPVGSLATPTRVLEHYLQQFDSSPNIPPTRRTTRRHQQGTIIPCTPGNQPPPVSSVELGYQRPPTRPPVSSPSLYTDIDTTRISETVRLSPDPPYPATTPETSVVPSTAESEPPRAKRPRPSRNAPGVRGLGRTANDSGAPTTPRRMPPPPPPPRAAPASSASSFVTARGYTQDSLEIRPPSPPPARDTLKPEDLVTFGLRRLAAQLSIPERYRPALQTRALDPFERGYWAVNCAGWPDDLKAYAWLELANYVGGGTAGWGVTCVRNPDFSELRVYCWGHVVAYIYLLLYLNSQRRLLKTEGVCWIDGESKVVITMGVKRG